MKVWARLALVVSAGLILVTYFFPLWRFELWAPQYPEGLAMQVWSFKLSGSIQNINILNHYVGMKPIEADSLSELKTFPYVLGFFAATGLLAAIIGRVGAARLWSIAFLAFCVYALYDFYSWEYKFGHDLSDDAPIKVEGMAYQPPFLGSRTLLTITAKSLPDIAGYSLTGAVFLASLILVFGKRRSAKSRPSFVSSAAMIILLQVLASCQSSGAQPLIYGEDTCAICKMVIADQRFGGEVRTTTGKVLKFDSLDCLIPYTKRNKDQIKEIWVVDSFDHGALISSLEAKFVAVPAIHSPMGQGVLSSKNLAALSNAAQGRPILDWSQLSDQYSA